MIARIWHGYTTQANTDTCDELLRNETFAAIADRNITSFGDIELLRCDVDGEVEFITIMWFDSLDAVREFAGEEYEAAVVPPAARAVLRRCDYRSAHYGVSAHVTQRAVS